MKTSTVVIFSDAQTHDLIIEPAIDDWLARLPAEIEIENVCLQNAFTAENPIEVIPGVSNYRLRMLRKQISEHSNFQRDRLGLDEVEFYSVYHYELEVI